MSWFNCLVHLLAYFSSLFGGCFDIWCVTFGEYGGEWQESLFAEFFCSILFIYACTFDIYSSNIFKDFIWNCLQYVVVEFNFKSIAVVCNRPVKICGFQLYQIVVYFKMLWLLCWSITPIKYI